MTEASDQAFAYCQYFCEENIWQLCAHPRVAGAERWVLFISNPAKRVAMWGQRAADDPTRPIVWDYHVVLLLRRGVQPWQVWDLDARDPDPRDAMEWLTDSFQAGGLFPPIYAPRFRLLRASEYRSHLRSDRRHMRRPDGTLEQPEPPWPVIMGEPPACAPIDDGSNLARFIDTEDPEFLGTRFDLGALARWLEAI